MDKLERINDLQKKVFEKIKSRISKKDKNIITNAIDISFREGEYQKELQIEDEVLSINKHSYSSLSDLREIIDSSVIGVKENIDNNIEIPFILQDLIEEIIKINTKNNLSTIILREYLYMIYNLGLDEGLKYRVKAMFGTYKDSINEYK